MNIKLNKTFFIIAALTAAAIINPALLFKGAGFVFTLLRPVIIGMGAAFVANRPACVIYDGIFRYLRRKKSRFSEKTCGRKVWLLSVALSYFIIAAVVMGIVWIVLPQLVKSISSVWNSGDIYMERIESYYRELKERDRLGFLPEPEAAAEKLSGVIPALLSELYSGIKMLAGGAADIAVGLVISVYITADKNSIRRAVKRLAVRLLTEETAAKTAAFYKRVYDIFFCFIRGQLTEAAVLGGLCYIGMKIFRFEYALLISVIIGVTALVPVVGAIVGTVPSALLLFLTEPMSAVWFIVFIIVLQQLENNFIYPRIVGKSMGLHPLPALIAVITGAKLGGGLGILLSVPLTAVGYGIYRDKIQGE
ncbi:MAG: AI-2E family transporter [Oscillospiraceae bacterium]|nr:AI-2E family transporter [Oscillospiraceae bacterium]